MMKRGLASLALIVAAAATWAALALANDQVVHDPQGDSHSDVDIASAKVDFDGKNLHFTVKAYGKIAGNNPCVQLAGGIFVGCLGSQISGGQLEGVPVKVDNGRKKNEFTVSVAKIGNPAKIKWRGAFLEEDQPADAAPDHGYAKFTLR